MRSVNAEALGRLHSPEGQAAVHDLTLPERFLCGWLIERQFSMQRVNSNLARYGLRGTVQLGSANAFRAYQLVLAVVAVICVFAGLGVAAGVLFALVVVLLIPMTTRACSSFRTGKHWRASQADPTSEST